MNVLQIFTLCFLIVLLFMGTPVGSHQGESDDKTLSPYFFVLSEEPDVDQLPLHSTSAVVNISGVIADVKVKQVYKNRGCKQSPPSLKGRGLFAEIIISDLLK
jgi:hypothetical protein